MEHRILEFFGRQYLNKLCEHHDIENIISSYKNIKFNYCNDNHIPLLFFARSGIPNPFEKLNKCEWDKEKLKLAMNISYPFHYTVIHKMVKYEHWDLIDKLPNSEYNNQLKIDIYFLTNKEMAFSKMVSLNIISAKAWISLFHEDKLMKYFTNKSACLKDMRKLFTSKNIIKLAVSNNMFPNFKMLSCVIPSAINVKALIMFLECGCILPKKFI